MTAKIDETFLGANNDGIVSVAEGVEVFGVDKVKRFVEDTIELKILVEGVDDRTVYLTGEIAKGFNFFEEAEGNGNGIFS